LKPKAVKKAGVPTNKVALITGAAHGIGKVVAESFAANGLSVVIVDIDSMSGKKLESDIRKKGAAALFIKADLRLEKEIRSTVDAVIERFGRLDIIINNARPKLTRFSFMESFKEWDMAMDVLLKAPALISKYAIPYLKRNKGCIINIVSTNAKFVSHQPVAYHIAKAGVVQLTRYLACELGPFGVRVNSICPGLVDLHDDNKPLTSDRANNIVVQLSVPLKRAGSAEDIAKAALFLCGDEAGYITGHVLVLDGGLTLRDHFNIAKKALLYTESRKV